MKEAGHSFVRIDGSVSAPNRITAMNRFNSDTLDAPRFILCSLLAAGTGINLTRANWAFMMDVWWNSAVGTSLMNYPSSNSAKLHSYHPFVNQKTKQWIESIVFLRLAK